MVVSVRQTVNHTKSVLKHLRQGELQFAPETQRSLCLVMTKAPSHKLGVLLYGNRPSEPDGFYFL